MFTPDVDETISSFSIIIYWNICSITSIYANTNDIHVSTNLNQSSWKFKGRGKNECRTIKYKQPH